MKGLPIIFIVGSLLTIRIKTMIMPSSINIRITIIFVLTYLPEKIGLSLKQLTERLFSKIHSRKSVNAVILMILVNMQFKKRKKRSDEGAYYFNNRRKSFIYSY